MIIQNNVKQKILKVLLSTSRNHPISNRKIIQFCHLNGELSYSKAQRIVRATLTQLIEEGFPIIRTANPNGGIYYGREIADIDIAIRHVQSLRNEYNRQVADLMVIRKDWNKDAQQNLHLSNC